MESAEEEKLPEPLGSDDKFDKCDDNPEFTVICSFISKFGSYIDLNLNIEELKSSIEDQETLHDSLIDIHVKLLKKLRRYFVRDQWEKALIRYAYEYSHADGFEIETMGYLKTRPSIKMQLLRRLLDAQFECDPKFKASVNLIDANELNIKPTGRDTEGNTYWHCRDDQGNLRVHREEPLRHESWTTICKNADDLKQLIEQLQATKDVKIKGEPQPEPYDPYPEIFPEFFVKEVPCDDAVGTGTKKATKKSSKKGKKTGRMNKKSNPLQTVVEDEETIDRIDIKPLVSQQNQLKQQEPPNPRPRSASPNGSIESHVKYTLENILNAVVSSFDYIFRRKSPEVQPGSASENIENRSNNARKRAVKRDKLKTEELPRRSSSRIQQLQQKKVEEEAIKKQQPEVKTKPTPGLHLKELSSLRTDGKSSKRDKKDKQRWRNNKGKKKLSWDKDDSDLSSISSPSESNDESFMEALNESIDHDNNDDEFACEDEATNDEPVIIKRARTARQTLDLEETNGLNNSSIIEEDKPCGRCDKSNDPDWILLCDMCDDGYHTTCCVPPLMFVPDGDWFCPLCEHKMLLQKLSEIYDSVVELLATREREQQKKQRLRQVAPKKDVTKTITDDIVPDKRRRDILNELNEPLAVQALDEDLKSSSGEELPSSYRESYSRQPKKSKKNKTKTKKRIKQQRYETDDDESDYELDRRYKKKPNNISESEFEEDSYEDEDNVADEFSESSSEDGEHLKARKARAFVSYKYEEYDELIRSAIHGDSDTEVAARPERDDSVVCNVGRGKDMATIEALAYQQENGLTSGELGPIKQPKQRRRGRKLNDLDAESEIDIATSDESFQATSGTEDIEDEDEDDATEVSLEDDSSIDEIVCMHQSRSKNKRFKRTKKRKRFDDDSEDSDFKPRSRRVAAQKVSYKESSDSEDEIIISRDIDPAPMTPNPINELTQYCSQDSYPSNPLFSSFKMSPPHPQFYKEDEVRSPTSDK